ncbi:hypothetical protein BH09VER1_BH09VER1_44260 [soil metagenome]
MNPSYCRIRTPLDDALERFAAWQGLPQVGPLVAASSSTAIDLACDERGNWRGQAVFVSEMPGWTLFQDLSGGLGYIPAEEWLKYSGTDELVFASYNDAISYGELVAISNGVILREFRQDRYSPDVNVNLGHLGDEHEPLRTWVEVASFMEADKLSFSNEGFLWIYRPSQ